MSALDTPFVALSIAGSDSSGGAGIAADLKTFAAHGVFGVVSITAITAQNTTGVSAIEPSRPELVHAQIDAVLEDFSIHFAKTGMLASVEIIESLADRAEADGLPELVVDPVLVAASGALLVSGDATRSYRRLLQCATVTTPNLAEAEALLGRSVRTRAEMGDAAKALCDLGVSTAVVKGGHLKGESAIDVVCHRGELHELGAPMIASRNTHGTGCTLSAAIVANLALGRDRLEAISLAKSYITHTIAASATWSLGKGHGPLAHQPPSWSGPPVF
jgi:hydroxymethylpyrimidine/phosphomethylpyrimidine kinase